MRIFVGSDEARTLAAPVQETRMLAPVEDVPSADTGYAAPFAAPEAAPSVASDNTIAATGPWR